uniref:Uncharacterized protein n=1 Tax=Glossina pallidipes TaxID=7398 RepID=A0A1A9Z5C5_GLOPL
MHNIFQALAVDNDVLVGANAAIAQWITLVMPNAHMILLTGHDAARQPRKELQVYFVTMGANGKTTAITTTKKAVYGVKLTTHHIFSHDARIQASKRVKQQQFHIARNCNKS